MAGLALLYEVRSAANTASWHPRHKLRQRVKHLEAYTGVSGDTRHDSYAMRRFVIKMLDDLKERSLLGATGSQMLTKLQGPSKRNPFCDILCVFRLLDNYTQLNVSFQIHYVA